MVLESTGRYHRAVHQALHARGLEVVLVNPLRTRRFAEALGLLAKTDTIDAAALAAYGTACLDLPATPPRSAFMEQLADLLVLRENHRDAQVSLRQAAMEVQDPELREEALQSVDQLGEQVATFDRKIRELIATDPDTDRRYRILTSIPGVGPVSAATLCCWMPELGTIGNRQAASLLGVAPFAHDSGRHQGARHIRGRRRPRDVLYMAAFSTTMHNPDLQRIFQRLKAAGKSHKVALVAVMRKLIILRQCAPARRPALGRDRMPPRLQEPCREACDVHGLAVLYSACGCDRSSEGSLALMDSADRFPIS